MAEKIATCSCANLRVSCAGEPFRVSMCHCLACQRRTGAPFGVQWWFQRDQLTITGNSTAYVRAVANGNQVTYQFCPRCGSTVYWELKDRPGAVAVALGMFADPSLPPPRVSVWERRQHPWTAHVVECQMEHIA
jgi:hypothetical protein